MAHTILTLAACGQPVPEPVLLMLAEQVLADPVSVLALDVLRDGPHRLSRGIELADLVLIRKARTEREAVREAGRVPAGESGCGLERRERWEH